MLIKNFPLKEKLSLPIKSQIIDMLDKSGFFFAFILGLIGIIFLKVGHYSQFWATFYPVLIMMSYAAVLYSFNRLRLGEEQAGDNLYYLGFLFTLISLAFALYQFDDNGGTAIIIENFGIALSTTIVGLLLRILFNKMRNDPVEIEREARLELATAATALRTDLLEVTHIMKGTLIAVQQQTVEIMSEYGKRFDKMTETIFIKTNEIHNGTVENSEKIQKSTEALVYGVEKLLCRIDEISPPTNLLETKLAPAIDLIQIASQEIQNRVKNDGAFVRQIAKVVKTALESSEILDTRIATMSDQSEKIGSVLKSFEEINAQITISSKNFQDASAQAGKTISLQQDVQDNLNKLLNESANLQASAIKDLESSIKDTLNTTKGHNLKLADELNLSREYTQKVHGSLVSLTESLSDFCAQKNDLSSIDLVVEQ